MDEPILVVISLTMFVGSYLAGCIPLFFSLNERRIRIASIFGAGLLVGTAFCVIIPEGISSLAESSFAYRNHNIIDANLPKLENGKTSGEKLHRRAIRDWENDQPQHHDERMNNFERLNGVIGLSLLVGFLFMHVIDQLSKLSHSRHKGVPTLGLVIHAFADGIAMGSASSAGSQAELQILVFVAIMLHKAPTAFALISILLASGMDKVRVRRHLLIFSLAAPIGTVLTYAFLHMIQSSSPSDGILTGTHKGTSSHFTGMVLLFSAGTFLYIATVHVLPELVEAKCSGTFAGGGMSGSREMLLGGGEKVVASASAPSRFSLIELCLFCTSAIIPSFISSATHGEYGH
ncbi:hypothetical protein GPALN_005382 [Globodera pallida]|nr:hypothetical protein GPALN_005382 [Globodera pallida]